MIQLLLHDNSQWQFSRIILNDEPKAGQQYIIIICNNIQSIAIFNADGWNEKSSFEKLVKFEVQH